MSARTLAALALAALLCCGATRAHAAFDADSARAKAHALTPVLMRGDAAAIWSEFADPMRAALKDSTSWATVLRGVLGQLGALDSLKREEVSAPDAGTFVVDDHCTFAKSPATIEMIFAFDARGRIAGLLFRPDTSEKRVEYPSRHLDYVTKTALRLPFRGEWFVVWGGRTLQQNYHAFTRDQRFAYDLLVVRDGHSHRGDGRHVEDYWCWDQPVLAPAAGTVVWAQDGIADNEPGHMDPAHATGNSLILDVGHGEFVLIAHLRQGTLRCKVGDRVAADAELGRCGNSGNTTEPHVHVHLQDGPKPFDAEGLPLQFVDYAADGKPVARGEPVQAQTVARAAR